MKRSDVISIVLVGAIGLIASYFGVNLLLGNPDDFSVTYKYVDEISADLAAVDENIFNPSAINPTVEVYVGQCVDVDGDGAISASERATCTTGVIEDSSSTESNPDNAEQTEPIPDPAGGGNVENSGGTPENGTANTE